MRKIITALAAALLLSVTAFAAPVSAGKPDKATTIQSGQLLTSDGRVIAVGFDMWGYNYQGHMFNGMYCDAYRDAPWCQNYKDDNLSMKWSDSWLANTDADDDGLLDRHLGYPTYRGSGAWLTNHTSGTYLDDNGRSVHWTYFVKIIAAPADATRTGGTWFAADGTELGPDIWGQFFIAQEIVNDPGDGTHGIQYLSPFGPGFGQF